MERQYCYQNIRHKLAYLATEVEIDAKVHLFDLHTHAEVFFSDLLNKMFGWNLINANTLKMNAESIDLYDSVNKILIQVSSRNDSTKIQDSLNKIDSKRFKNYKYNYVSISRDCSKLRNKKYTIPQDITFNASNDIFDITCLLKKIETAPIDLLKDVSTFLDNEIHPINSGIVRPHTITCIINLLAKEDLESIPTICDTKTFEINKKIQFNQLQIWENHIKEYAPYSSTIDSIYEIFNKQGKNKSLAVLNHLHSIYLSLENKYDSDSLFDEILEKVKNDINNDTSCSLDLSPEDIEMNTRIVLVDAFLKCKIFKKPE